MSHSSDYKKHSEDFSDFYNDLIFFIIKRPSAVLWEECSRSPEKRGDLVQFKWIFARGLIGFK